MEEKVYPPVTVVDDTDTVIGYLGLFDALAKGLRRRVAYCIVRDESNRMLIQRRSGEVLSPNLLDFAAAGHVNEGQTYLDAARAELEEELGLKGFLLSEVVPPFATPGFYNGVYMAVVPDNTEPIINPEEVSGVFWVSKDEILKMIAGHPQQFTEPFLGVWPHVCDKIFS
ncbi:MAG: hypothetical protein RL538_703 [Candidatus Parcubacteria bacterium]|jgi:isopentenyldiphosphate isomerase